MIEKGKRYISISPEGVKDLVIVSTDADVERHQKLSDDGYDYKELQVHNAPKESACISCEG